jgi:hypothetical protein
MLLRALLIWCVILLFASANGALRDLVLAPRLGDTVARAVSTIVLSLIILAVAWCSIGWIGSSTIRQAILVGVLWVGLTLAFEFLAGHYLFHKPWATLLEDYNIRRGRIWVMVPVLTLLAPLWMGRLRDLVR